MPRPFKSFTVRWGIGVVILIGGVLGVTALTRSNPAWSRLSRSIWKSDGESRDRREAELVSFKDPRLEKLFKKRFFPEARLEDFQDFLRVSGNSPEALCLVAMAARDPLTFQQLEALRNNPAACQVLYNHSPSSLDRLRWAEALIASDSNNLLGYLYKANALFEVGDADAAVRIFDEHHDLEAVDRLLPTLRFTEETARSIPESRALEIAYQDGPTWAQQSIEPMLQAMVKYAAQKAEAKTLTVEDLAKLRRWEDSLLQHSDFRVRNHVESLIHYRNYGIAKYLQTNPDIALYWDSPDLAWEKRGSVMTESETKQKQLVTMENDTVSSQSLNWLTGTQE